MVVDENFRYEGSLVVFGDTMESPCLGIFEVPLQIFHLGLETICE